MVIESNLLAIFNAMTKNRNLWSQVTEKQKEDFFFIINRMMSKKYPFLSQSLNTKGQDPVVGMDIWFSFFEGKPYPSWFWSKSTDSSKKDKERSKLLEYFDIKEEELQLLENFHSDELEEELKYIKNSNKSQ